MSFIEPPRTAAWEHREARAGFEVVFFRVDEDGVAANGVTTAVEDGEAWAVGYWIALDASWTTRRARIWAHSSAGSRSLVIERSRPGRWLAGGEAAPHLDHCLDVDLESSAMTNAFPVHRMGLAVGDRADAPAAYVRAVDLAVERLEQSYRRDVDDEQSHQRYDYAAPVFDVSCRLVYDEYGLVLDYPGIARRTS